MSFAKIIVVGNLTRDPETAYTQSGALHVKFGIAADGRKKGENTR
jgi:single-stranded DNA-binding protein